VLGESGSYLERAFAEVDRGGREEPVAGRPASRPRDDRGRGIAALITNLIATGEPLLVLCADARARERHLSSRLGGFALASYAALERGTVDAGAFAHVVLLDPPAGAHQLGLATAGAHGRSRLAYGAAELRFAIHIHEQEFGLRDPLADCYRTLRDRGGAAGRDLETVLRGAGPLPRSPELAGRLLAVLTEIGLVGLDRGRDAAAVIARGRATLEDSAAYRAYERRREDGLRYLGSRTRQAA
jgi:hypothetical protein